MRSVGEIGRDLGSFQLVEGRVLDAERRGDRWYLNFGDDWRSDFTVTIPAQRAAGLRRRQTRSVRAEGPVIRVRGWVESLNGPMIEAVIPEQIEVLDESRRVGCVSLALLHQQAALARDPADVQEEDGGEHSRRRR